MKVWKYLKMATLLLVSAIWNTFLSGETVSTPLLEMSNPSPNGYCLWKSFPGGERTFLPGAPQVPNLSFIFYHLVMQQVLCLFSPAGDFKDLELNLLGAKPALPLPSLLTLGNLLRLTESRCPHL